MSNKGVILYDGNCGVCKILAQKWEAKLATVGYAVQSYQAWVTRDSTGTQLDINPKDIILIKDNGESISGPNVYRYIFRNYWLTYPVYILSRIPILSWVFDLVYRKFADNRHRLSESCKLNKS